MIDPKIKIERAESALYEALCTALGTLNDEELNALTLLEVKLASGKKDAHLYIDGAAVPAADRPRMLAKLKRASSHLARFVTASEGWYKSPLLHFVFDDREGEAARMDELFKKINTK
ncbi:hypothetical protein AGMMS50229_06540 [Campylobacterota bacterium]|nr:hypothetical protein AGMMS50229_06540 [Campylobacterota bacterium]